MGSGIAIISTDEIIFFLCNTVCLVVKKFNNNSNTSQFVLKWQIMIMPLAALWETYCIVTICGGEI
jgi:hypothetical protein